MFEPGLNPTAESGSGDPEGLTPAQGESPDPANHPSAAESGSDVPADLSLVPGQNPDPAHGPSAAESGSDIPEDLSLAQVQPPDPADHPSASPADPPAGPVPSSSPKRTEDDGKLEDHDGAKGGEADHNASTKGNLAARILSGLGPVAKGAGSAARQGVQLARSYPRASMASGLSTAILMSVMVFQPGKGKHEDTAALPGTAAQSQTASAGPQASGNAASPAPKPDDAAPDAGQAVADSVPPMKLEGQDPKAGKIPPEKSSPDPAPGPGILAGEKATPAPSGGDAPASGLAAVADSRPAPAPTESIPLLAGNPAKLNASESSVPLPPVEGDAAPVVVGAGEKSADPAPAPAPVLELAETDTKPGTPPNPASAPAPAPAPTPAPEPGPGAHAPDPPASALAPAPAPAGEPKPQGNDSKDPGRETSQAKPIPEPAKTSALLAPHEPPGAGAAPIPVPGSVPEPGPAPSRVEPLASPADLSTLHSAGDPGPGKSISADPPIQGQNPSLTPSQDQPRPSAPVETAAPKPRDEPAKPDWVPIKHSGGNTVRDVQRDVPGPDEDSAAGAAQAGTTDPGAHADKEQSFDVEAPPGRAAARGAGAASTAAGDPAVARSARSEGKLDTVLHKVEKNENFWTIARMYYNSGRYYRALWKANVDKVPEIDKLYRNTVIRIPPPEDLDPAYILPAGTRSPRSEGVKLAAQNADPDRSPSRGSTPAGGVPIRRSSRSDAELNLPVADAAGEEADGTPGAPRRGRDDDREPEIRPRDAVTRPIYKVRQYDTLRTIARDTLGDARRADEILDLNRDIIDDPSHLIVGQILDLPEDARTPRPRGRR